MYDVILDMDDAMEERELLEPAPGEPVNPVGVTDPPLKPESNDRKRKMKILILRIWRGFLSDIQLSTFIFH